MNNPREMTEVQIMQAPQGPLTGTPYGQPVVQAENQRTLVINNQLTDTRPKPEDFKTTPITLVCQFCKKPITTEVSKSLDICACLLCYCTCIMFYVCVQAIRKKDLCCWNAKHRCPYCHNVVGTYTSC